MKNPRKKKKKPKSRIIDELFEHWCNNPNCEEYTNDPDNDKGIRHVFNGEETLKPNPCPYCKRLLISRLDVNLFDLQLELNITHVLIS